jgi:DNA-binding transcriptional ArsR family regulator
VLVVEDPETAQVVSHATRLEVLRALETPASAAAVARAIGQTRQNANYHLKELERVGLVERVGERRTGNFVETLYRARARTVMLSPRLIGGPRHAQALADQVSLEKLVRLGERLGRDATVLLDRAAFEGAAIPSASIEAEVRFASVADRQAFVDEYLATLAALTERYASRSGEPYRIAAAAYPDPDQEES